MAASVSYTPKFAPARNSSTTEATQHGHSNHRKSSLFLNRSFGLAAGWQLTARQHVVAQPSLFKRRLLGKLRFEHRLYLEED
jgi:hypothetical protein